MTVCRCYLCPLQLEAVIPKSPFSQYLEFCQRERGKLAKKHPTFSPTQITQELGRAWKAMDTAKRVSSSTALG